MYLKSIELFGFKSFAEKTRLEFEPCMTAIVGPNGCGKSNIADALRWVLGEQSTKALRGSRMEDMIFNGTDSHKPLSMAEVSLTLAGCEDKLGVEYDEVTVTRRVLRSGEGQYYINKTPCRLKDIQRLFMDTGIGTNSYSMMEQGRIDQILSSRPEDRRAVFEEASGITKYKADKKEAIRKLEHTEANLLRLADIMREVKRRIISLQRQAGKARRYKALQDELRGFDVYLSRQKIHAQQAEIKALESRLASLDEQEEAFQADIRTLEQESRDIRDGLARTENHIAAAMEAAVQAQTERDRNQELIRINEDRIRELEALSKRDSRDADDARSRLDVHRKKMDEHETQCARAVEAREQAQQELDQSNERLRKQDEAVHQARDNLNGLRTESIDLESRLARLQNELSEMDGEERTGVVRRERLTAELNELRRGVEKFEARESETRTQIETLQAQVSQCEEHVRETIDRRDTTGREMEKIHAERNDLHNRIAARKAQSELFEDPGTHSEGLPPGARWLIDAAPAAAGEPRHILGALADHLDADPEYQVALEAALRAWLDALIVTDANTLPSMLKALEEGRHGTARLLSLPDRAPEDAGDPGDIPGESLLDHVRCSDTIQPLAQYLLRRVRVVDAAHVIPAPAPKDVTYVTRTGALIRPDGSAEFWMPEKNESNPMTRRHLLSRWKQELEELTRRETERSRQLVDVRSEWNRLNEEVDRMRADLEENSRKLALREGEYQVKSDEANQARERLETVSYELNALNEQHTTSGDRRKAILTELESVRHRQSEIRSEYTLRSDELKQLEQKRSEYWTETTEKRVQLAEQRQQVDHLTSAQESLAARIHELEALIHERTEGLSDYQRRVQELETMIRSAQDRVQPLEAEVERHNKALAESRMQREQNSARQSDYESRLREKREALETHRKQRSGIEVTLAEERMRVQNTLERLSMDYRLTPEQLMSEPDPEWKDGEPPDRETLETFVAEIRAKLESMGPVNLVAIEEHEELEERLRFLSEQHDDLVRAKQQLLDMIRRINRTTTEMFTQTFEAVNSNFQETFKKLFGGGSAKLVLVDDEDVLESGIEMIARPPGKKLQSVSLLSGGERTMTAVALLFALYKVKPSPFCMLDELDAALDDTNIGRFIRMLKEFLTDSQFVIITHNRQTIESADTLYGVTMEKHGVSKIVSVKFSRTGKEYETADT